MVLVSATMHFRSQLGNVTAQSPSAADQPPEEWEIICANVTSTATSKSWLFGIGHAI